MKLPKHIKKVHIKSLSDQLKYRKTGFGGSDLGALCGLSQYKSALACIESKITDTPDIQSEPAYFGQILEPVIADEFSLRNPDLKIINPKGYLLVDKQYPYMIASLDRIIDYGDSQAPLEIKTASAFLAADWKKGLIPPSYNVQVQWYMRALGADHAWLAALLGGQEYVQYRIERDQRIIDALEQIAHQFWPYVEKKQLPPLAFANAADMSRLFPNDDGTKIDLGGDVDELIVNLDALKEQQKGLEKQIENIELQLKQILQVAEMGVSPSKRFVKWKTTSSSRLNTKKLKAEHPELYEQYQETSSSRRLSTGRLKTDKEAA